MECFLKLRIFIKKNWVQHAVYHIGPAAGATQALRGIPLSLDVMQA